MDPRYEKIYNTPSPDNPYYEHLYARGYLISDKPCVVKENWKQRSFGNGLYITYDGRNECEYVTLNDTWVLILGTVMDTLSYHMETKRIASVIAQKYILGEDILYDYLDYLGGRHLIVYGNDREAYLVQDATGMRSVCYHRHSLLIASHYHIIQNIVQADKSPYVAELANMKPIPWLLPGNTTPYLDIMMLMPNHRLGLYDRKLKRIFPRGPHLNVDVDEAMDYIAECCKQQMQTLARSKKVMLSITKGNDARITMAATKDINEVFLFYTYYGEEDPSHMQDLRFAQEFAKKHELNYVKVPCKFSDPPSQYSSLTDVCYHNHYHFHLFYSIPNMLKKLPSDRIAVRSNLIEIIRADYYSDLPAKSSWERVAKRLYYGHLIDDPDYRNLMQDFFYENEYDKLFDYHTGDLIYWEYRMGLWMNNGVLLKDDICFDTYMLFNHRKMLEYGLSIPRYFKKKNAVVHEVIRRLWPELLFDIPNTDYTLMDYYDTDAKNLAELKAGSVRGYRNGDNGRVPVYFNIGRYHGIFGFGNNRIRKGDICEFNVDIPISMEGPNVIQLTIKVSSEFNYSANFACYSILLDGTEVFSLGLTDFMNKENQINIIKYMSKGTAKLTIRLKANMDYDASDGSPGLLQLRNISVYRQGNYAVTDIPTVFSTDQFFRKNIKFK